MHEIVITLTATDAGCNEIKTAPTGFDVDIEDLFNTSTRVIQALSYLMELGVIDSYDLRVKEVE